MGKNVLTVARLIKTIISNPKKYNTPKNVIKHIKKLGKYKDNTIYKCLWDIIIRLKFCDKFNNNKYINKTGKLSNVASLEDYFKNTKITDYNIRDHIDSLLYNKQVKKYVSFFNILKRKDLKKCYKRFLKFFKVNKLKLKDINKTFFYVLYNDNKTIAKIILIQKIWKGTVVRKKNKSLKYSMTYDLLNEYIDGYNNYVKLQRKLNNNLERKKIRLSNFPSEISENIVKFAVFKKYNIMLSWDTNRGYLKLVNKTIEVKASSDLYNGGPSSFGPTESWYRIYFIDCVKAYKKEFKVYEIKLSNKDNYWKNIKVNNKQTYEDQCIDNRRPRITFRQLIKQIPNEYVTTIFDGPISSLCK
jgi:hypothetical protein